MPRMHLGGRAVDLSSDDLLCPAGTSLAFRAGWLAACCVFVAFARPLLACSAPLWALVVANIAWGTPMLALDAYLAVATTRGTLLADAPRKSVPLACTARSVAAPVDAALCVAVLVAAAVAGAPGACDPLAAQPIGAAGDGLTPSAPLWVVILVFAAVGAAVFSAFACCAATLWAVAPSAALYRRLARATGTAVMAAGPHGDHVGDDEALSTAARRWSRCCFLCSRCFSVGTLTHPGISTAAGAPTAAPPSSQHAYLRPPFDAIGAIMAGVFEGAERLGLTASDLCAGFALVRAVQKDEERAVLEALAREHAAQDALRRAATATVSPTGGAGPSLQPPLPPLPGLSPEGGSGTVAPTAQQGAPARVPPAARRRFSSSLLRPFTLLTAGSSATSPDAASAAPPTATDAASAAPTATAVPAARLRLPQLLPSVSSVMASARALVRQHRTTLAAHRLYAQHLTGTAPLDTGAPADRAALDEAAHFAPYATAAYGYLIAAYMAPLTCACVLPAVAVAYTAGDVCADVATSRAAWRRWWGDVTSRAHYTHCHGVGRRGPLARVWRLAASCGRRLRCRRDARSAAIARAAAAAAADVDEERGGGLASGDVCGCNESALRWILQRHLRRDAAPDPAVEQVLLAAAAVTPAVAPARGTDRDATDGTGGVLLLAAGTVSIASSDDGNNSGSGAGGELPTNAPQPLLATGAEKDGAPSQPPPPVTPAATGAASAPLLPHSLGAGTSVAAQPFPAPASPTSAPAPFGATPRSLRHAILHTSHTNAPLSTPWYVAVDARRRALVVAIRGTLSVDDALTDALAWPLGGRRTADVADTARLLGAAGVSPPPDPRRCYVHGGMWEAAKRVRDALLRHGLLETVDPGPGGVPFPASVAAAAAAGSRTAACCTRPDHCGPACAFAAAAATAERRDSARAEALPTSFDSGSGTTPSHSSSSSPRLRLVIVGHSLGAGVGALLSLLLRPHYTALRCYAISPPGALVSRHLGATMDGWTVSVVVGKDLVPRMSLPSLHGLLDEATDYLGRAPSVSKPGLVAALCGACVASTCVPSACYPLCAPVAHTATAASSGGGGGSGCWCRSCAGGGTAVLSPTMASTAAAAPSTGAPSVSPLAATGGGRSPFRLRARSLLLPPGAPLPPEADTAFARALRTAAATRAPLRAALQRDAAGDDVEEGGGRGGAGAVAAVSTASALGGTLTPAAAPAAAEGGVGSTVAAVGPSAADWTTRPRAASAASTASTGSEWSDDASDSDSNQQQQHAAAEMVAVDVDAPDTVAIVQQVAEAVAPAPPTAAGGPSLLAARVRAPPPLLSAPSPVPAAATAAEPPTPPRPLSPFTPPASLAAQRSLLSRPMFLPGRILTLVKVHAAAVDVPTAACRRALPAHPAATDRLAAVFCCCFRRVRRVYEPRWGRRGGFRRIQVSSDMVADHMPDHAHESLRAAADDALGGGL